MNIIKTELQGVLIIEPSVFGDSRGWFMESWSDTKMVGAGLKYDFVQDNHSFSSQKGILRGIHFQQTPYAQTKLVRCTQGAVLDVAIDLRKNSPTYKKWVAVELSAENKLQLLIPRGFGHGFVTLTENVDFLYKTDNPYNAASDRNIRYNDPELAIDWGIANPILSEKDAIAPFLRDSDCNFVLEDAQ
ncbi:MAG: dTDP-4-dehydrorhamnose 3,5-epimerase [Defluviitaleaceae bacterium]|nr:dTDP-4-dehydrorhamnose 3,5-epimerase [Defluviitaleaceae bacterium]